MRRRKAEASFQLAETHPAVEGSTNPTAILRGGDRIDPAGPGVAPRGAGQRRDLLRKTVPRRAAAAPEIDHATGPPAQCCGVAVRLGDDWCDRVVDRARR